MHGFVVTDRYNLILICMGYLYDLFQLNHHCRHHCHHHRHRRQRPHKVSNHNHQCHRQFSFLDVYKFAELVT